MAGVGETWKKGGRIVFFNRDGRAPRFLPGKGWIRGRNKPPAPNPAKRIYFFTREVLGMRVWVEITSGMRRTFS